MHPLRRFSLAVIPSFFLALAACAGPTGPAGPAGPKGATGDTGAAGADGRSVLVTTTPEPAGANCANGGVRVDTGLDTNGNGTLDPSEITDTKYVCNGADGTAGAAGTTALVSTSPEPAGANCQYGGTKVESGLDTNGNGTLDPSEVTDTAYVCDGPGLSWVNVTTDTAVQTASNTGYIDNNGTAQVTFTLPPSPAIGDTVRFTGAAGPGYVVAQNAGQSVSLAGLGPYSALSGTSFTQLSVPLTQSGGYSVATSADGQVVVAVVEWYTGILVSYDGGQTFGTMALPSGFAGQKVGFPAVSPDGKTIYVGAYGNTSGFFMSQNGGPLVNVTTLNGIGWFAPFSGGGVLAFVTQSAATPGIWLSKDYGQTWTQQTMTGAPTLPCWESVAASYDGKTLAAAASGVGSCPVIGIYVSSDSGQTWRESSGTGSPIGDRTPWVSVSPSGNEVAVTYNEKYPIFLSNDGGVTWRNTGSFTTNARPAALSTDGRRIVVADPTQTRVIVSNDAGATWTPYATNAVPNSVAGSRSLSPVYIGAHDSTGVYVEQSMSTLSISGMTTVGTAGSVTAGVGDALELQYLGSGSWMAISGMGSDFVVQ